MTPEDLITRYYHLRKMGLLEPILHEPGPEGSRFYRFTNPADPWGSKERITLEQFAQLLSSAAKPVASETSTKALIAKLVV